MLRVGAQSTRNRRQNRRSIAIRLWRLREMRRCQSVWQDISRSAAKSTVAGFLAKPGADSDGSCLPVLRPIALSFAPYERKVRPWSQTVLAFRNRMVLRVAHVVTSASGCCADATSRVRRKWRPAGHGRRLLRSQPGFHAPAQESGDDHCSIGLAYEFQKSTAGSPFAAGMFRWMRSSPKASIYRF